MSAGGVCGSDQGGTDDCSDIGSRGKSLFKVWGNFLYGGSMSKFMLESVVIKVLCFALDFKICQLKIPAIVKVSAFDTVSVQGASAVVYSYYLLPSGVSKELGHHNRPHYEPRKGEQYFLARNAQRTRPQKRLQSPHTSDIHPAS